MENEFLNCYIKEKTHSNLIINKKEMHAISFRHPRHYHFLCVIFQENFIFFHLKESDNWKLVQAALLQLLLKSHDSQQILIGGDGGTCKRIPKKVSD